MSKEILLSQGKVAIVDDGDFDWLSQWKWSAARRGKKIETWYAVRTVNRKVILMHRLIGDAPKGKSVDHRNLDGLDNRRANLRVCSQSENSLNQTGHADRGASRFKGVWWHKQSRKWAADFRGKYLGIFVEETDAARAYDAAAIAFSPEFARPNFAQGGA